MSKRKFSLKNAAKHEKRPRSGLLRLGLARAMMRTSNENHADQRKPPELKVDKPVAVTKLRLRNLRSGQKAG